MSNEEIAKVYDLLREQGDKLASVSERVSVLTVQFGTIAREIETGRSRMWGIAEKVLILAAGAVVGHFLGQ